MSEFHVLPPWEQLRCQVLWAQLGEIKGKRMLDFGSGIGVTADHFAKENEVIAVEPALDSIEKRWQHHSYCQIRGSVEALREMPDASFDWIFCHNVLEYALDRENILQEFSRLLKGEGTLSVLKHHRPGRVMQMAVLLDDFEHANALLDGMDGKAAAYGTIHYYEDADIEAWRPDFRITDVQGICAFWRLQQKQEKHPDSEWQKKMTALDLRVSRMEPYRSIAFFHHLLIRKK